MLMKFENFFQNDFGIFLPEFFLTLSILTILIYGSFQVALAASLYNFLTFNTSRLTLLIIMLTFILVFNCSSCVHNHAVWNFSFVVNKSSYWSKIIILLGMFACVLLSENYLFLACFRSFEIFIFFLGSCLGLFLLVSSYNLLSVYLSVEIISLMFYVLTSIKKTSLFSAEAALKYFILGSLSSVFFLFGSSIIYISLGTINYQSLLLLCLKYNCCSVLAYIGFFFVCSFFLFKIGVAPFHMWLIDVYEGAPSLVGFLFAVIPKFAFFIALCRFCFNITPWFFLMLWENLLFFCGFFSIFISCLGGLGELKIKRLLGYSSIGHAGYIVFGLSTGLINGVQAVFLYLLLYMLTSAYLWICVLYLNIYVKKKDLLLSDVIGLVETNPLLSFFTALILFSLAGIPPFGGFFAKLHIFFCLINVSFYLTSLFIILTSIISTFYYVRIVKIIYLEKPYTWFYFGALQKTQAVLLCFYFFVVVCFAFNANLLYYFSLKLSLTFFE